MSSGYSAVRVCIVDDETLLRLFPQEYTAFMDIFKEDKVSKHAVVSFLNDTDPSILVDRLYDLYRNDDLVDLKLEEIISVWDNLKVKWEQLTGLSMYFGYHDSDAEGSAYDEIDGHFFYLEGVYELTEHAKKARNLWCDASFVVFG